MKGDLLYMKLNNDCVRDILLCTEENTGYHTAIVISQDSMPFQILQAYNPEEVLYHIEQCKKADLIETKNFINGGISINDLTPNGHDFLANIRSDTVWNDTKAVGQKIGITSLSALLQISTGVVTTLIKSQLGLL